MGAQHHTWEYSPVVDHIPDSFRKRQERRRQELIGTVRCPGCCVGMRLLLLFALLAGCSKGPQADLQYISQARSLGAEWAMVNEQAAKGSLTRAFVSTMRQSIREQLQTAGSSLTEPKSAYANQIRTLISEPDDAPPAELRAHAAKLKQIEDSLESA